MASAGRPYVVEIPCKRGKLIFQTVENHVELVVVNEHGLTMSVDLDTADKKAILEFLPLVKAR